MCLLEESSCGIGSFLSCVNGDLNILSILTYVWLISSAMNLQDVSSAVLCFRLFTSWCLCSAVFHPNYKVKVLHAFGTYPTSYHGDLKHGLTLFGSEEVIREDIFTDLEEAISHRVLECCGIQSFTKCGMPMTRDKRSGKNSSSISSYMSKPFSSYK